MGWGKFDDRYALNRKVRPLSDAAFRLDVSAILWCGAQLTDGRIDRDELDQVSDVKAPRKAAEELVRRGRWHVQGEGCDTEQCPVGETGNGWQIHDYLDFNDSKRVVLDRRKADRERKKKPPVPDGKPPGKSPGIPEDSGRNPAGVQPESHAESNGNPNGLRPSALPRARTRAPAPRPVPSGSTSTGQLDQPGASVDAHEPEPAERTVAQRLTARYAAGVRLADPGQAMRTIRDALAEGIPERLIDGGIDVLVAEQSSCTRGRLRVALLKAEGNWGQPGTAGNPYLNDLRAAAVDPAPPVLRALRALEAK